MIQWDEAAISVEATANLQGLLRFDTTNPPGNEIGAIQYLAEILKREGIESTILESAPGRANLVARLKGDGSQKPFPPLSRFVQVAGIEQRLQGEGGIAHPAKAIVPVADAAQQFWQRSCWRGYDSAGGQKCQGLQCDQ